MKVSRYASPAFAVILRHDRLKNLPVLIDDFGKVDERSVSKRPIAWCLVFLPSFLAALPDAERYASAPVIGFAKLPHEDVMDHIVNRYLGFCHMLVEISSEDPPP